MLKIQHIACALALLAACVARRPDLQSYRLTRAGDSVVLLPPGVASPRTSHRSIPTDIDRSCRASVPIALRPRGSHLQATVWRDRLSHLPAGWLADWAAGLELRGCIPPGEALALATRIAEAAPLSPDQGFRLLYSVTQGDIVPQTRIQVVTPIFGQSAVLDGYETDWYNIESVPGRAGVRIRPRAAERVIAGVSQQLPGPRESYFRSLPGVGIYRLFYKQDQTGLAAWVVAAATRPELDARTQALQTGTLTCEALGPSECVAIPRMAAINLFLPVSVNGREVLVPWAGTIGQALRAAGAPSPQSLLSRLTISRPHDGRLLPVRFDSTSPAILNLPLVGGEVINWK